ncbi:hypothetical protein ABK040_009280 [Willaertia magna]
MFRKERSLKKQKVNEPYFETNTISHFFSAIVVFTIAKFIEKKQDYFALEVMMTNIELLSNLLKREAIKSIKFPDYLQKNLKCLSFRKVYKINNLQNFTNLKYLKIDDKNFKRVKDEMFQNLTNLEELELKDCNINGSCFNYLKFNLKKLNLKRTKVKINT